ncbi:MAG: hypothetical protein GXO95_02655 [Nitrospirae bacterium]|nr:hypothetical protein [Nitrospirota bacterium]
MIKRDDGITLIEMLIAMVMFVLVIAAASAVFIPLLTQFKQQSKISETQIEGIIGLELLRRDIEHAGYGLPWNGLITYSESASNPFSLNDAPTGTPRAIISQNNVTTYSAPNNIFNGTDYLAIKAATAAGNYVAGKWTHLGVNGTKTWRPDRENINKKDDGTTNDNVRVIVISPGTTTATERTLVVDGTQFFTMYSNVTSTPWAPTDPTETRFVYGIDPDVDLRMPFNRSDYFVRRYDSSENNITPQRCAPNTGVLEKATVKHGDGGFAYLPVLDCVADFQVTFWLDTDNDGDIDWPPSDDICTLTAKELREQLKEVRVYIVAHEGQRDANYDFSGDNSRETLSAMEISGTDSRTITFTNLKTLVGNPDYKFYRWKVYTITVSTENLR